MCYDAVDLTIASPGYSYFLTMGNLKNKKHHGITEDCTTGIQD